MSSQIIVNDKNMLYCISVSNDIKKCTCSELSEYNSCKHLKKEFGKSEEKKRVQQYKKTKNHLQKQEIEEFSSLQNGSFITVDSNTFNNVKYVITKKYQSYTCSCPSFKYSKKKTCKHIEERLESV